MKVEIIFTKLLLFSSLLFGLDYHTDGKPIYEPMDVEVIEPMSVPVIKPMTDTQKSLILASGWNLIGINSAMTLNDILTRIGVGNLETIQGDDTIYSTAFPSINNFIALEKGEGYWIKVKQDTSLNYSQLTYSDKTIALKSGWSLINPLGELTLSQILTQVGIANLQAIQGAEKTYQKRYVDQGLQTLNDFAQFEAGKGYWIKVEQGVNLVF